MIKQFVKKYVLVIAVGIQIIIILFCNYFKAVSMLDMDSSIAVRHAVEMWRNKTIFLKDFGYTTSMEIDCASFLAAPVYIMTGNYALSITLAHIVLDGILIYVIYNLLKNMNVSYGFRILGILLVFTPYKYGQLSWDNMIFLSVGQYEFRVISALFLFMILSYRESFNKRHWVEYGISQVFVFVTVLSTGNYLIITVLGPLVLYEFFLVLKKEKFDLKNRDLWLIIGSVVTALCAYGIRVMMQISTGRSNMNIIKETEFSENLLNCFTGIVSLFGGLVSNDTPVLSIKGIAFLARFLFVCTILLIAFTGLMKHKEIKENKPFLQRFSFVFFVNMLIFLYTNTRYGSLIFEERYHIVWCVLLLMADIMILSEEWKYIGKWMQKAIAVCLAMGIVIINVSGFSVVWKITDINQPVIQYILEVADKYDIKDIIVLDAVIARKTGAVDIDKSVQLAGIDETNGMLGFNAWGWYLNTSVDVQNLMVISDRDLQKLAVGIKDAYWEVGSYNEWHILMTDCYTW